MSDANPNLSQRLLKKIIVAIPFAAAIAVLVTLLAVIQKSATRIASQLSQLHRLGLATKNFYADLNRWPTNLTELRSNTSQKTPFRGSIIDQWRRPYIFIPPTSNSPAKIQTFGADGNPNGDKTDGDASIDIK